MMHRAPLVGSLAVGLTLGILILLPPGWHADAAGPKFLQWSCHVLTAVSLCACSCHQRCPSKAARGRHLPAPGCACACGRPGAAGCPET